MRLEFNKCGLIRDNECISNESELFERDHRLSFSVKRFWSFYICEVESRLGNPQVVDSNPFIGDIFIQSQILVNTLLIFDSLIVVINLLNSFSDVYDLPDLISSLVNASSGWLAQSWNSLTEGSTLYSTCEGFTFTSEINKHA